MAAATSSAIVPPSRSFIGCDGDTHTIETADYIHEIFTLPDGVEKTLLLHPSFTRTTTNNIRLNKRLQFVDGSNDQCGYSTFTDITDNSTSPFAEDCGVIRDNYGALSGYFRVNYLDLIVNKYCYLIMIGTCVFGITTNDTLGTMVGTEDIHDIMRDSINQFTQNTGRVGATGNVTCNAGDTTVTVTWVIQGLLQNPI
ncbi:putative necrosis-inducing factor-domain-containing protein [Bombardia bombarda]|uniref:Necrosis-inducing factor-domain-containing protein n=1 Tax=Bombardia bombarda TaxID=252184 RepID=A0AA39TGZ3_9PEZI|nr:putative necrosis-inducing factor-domain-containing protein [Bombardia bombarda]